jgi:hypothetical protein
MVRLDPVVSVLLGSVPGRWQQLLQHHQIGRRLVSNDLSRRHPRRADGPLKEPVRRRRIPPRGHVDDLAELVDRTIDVPPAAADLTYVSSTDQRSPTRWRQGRAASASSGVKRSTRL